MAEIQIVELNHRHMAIAEYLLANPSARLTEVAAAVGLSPSWVSVVTNSDLFREYLRQRSREINDVVHISLQEKVQGIAHRAVEKLGEAVDNSQDPAFLLAAADKTLHRLGYGAKQGPVVNVNGAQAAPPPATHVDITIIQQAREKVYALAGRGQGAPQIGSPEELQTLVYDQPSVGADAREPAALSPPDEAQGAEGRGPEVREEGAGASGGESPGLASSSPSVDLVSGK